MEKPLLSICIPTFNRAEYLKKSLDSLVAQEGFSEIEVVISDNCSTDTTEDVCKLYTERYTNIVYHRNSENIHDRNFPTVLTEATGIYRKLYNDNMIHLSGSIRYTLDLVKSYKDSRPFMFFLHGKTGAKQILGDEKSEISTLDELILYTSHHFTWLAGFGFWEDECSDFERTLTYCEKKLWQTYAGLSSAAEKKHSVIVTRKLIDWLPVAGKDYSYGLYTVFFNNFPEILTDFSKNHGVSQNTISAVRKHMLYTLAGGWISDVCNHSDAKIGTQQDYMKLIFQDYKKEKYYLSFRIWLFLYKSRRKTMLNAKKIIGNTPFGKKLLDAKRRLKLKFY